MNNETTVLSEKLVTTLNMRDADIDILTSNGFDTEVITVSRGRFVKAWLFELPDAMTCLDGAITRIPITFGLLGAETDTWPLLDSIAQAGEVLGLGGSEELMAWNQYCRTAEDDEEESTPEECDEWNAKADALRDTAIRAINIAAANLLNSTITK
jgi:hypothetical protein